MEEGKTKLHRRIAKARRTLASIKAKSDGSTEHTAVEKLLLNEILKIEERVRKRQEESQLESDRFKESIRELEEECIELKEEKKQLVEERQRLSMERKLKREFRRFLQDVPVKSTADVIEDYRLQQRRLLDDKLLEESSRGW